MKGEVRLETGFHTLTDGQLRGVKDSWRIDAKPDSVWNGAVAERIAGYAPPAVVIDGLTSEYDDRINYQDKLFILSVLPAVPEKLNGKESITVIAGDLTEAHPDPVTAKNIALIMSNGLAFAYGSMYVGDKIGQELDYRAAQRDPLEAQKISRRDFLSTLMGASAVLAFGSIGLTTMFNNKVASSIARGGEIIAEPFSYHQRLSGLEPFTQGRTALMLEKAIYASENNFEGAEIPAVMGTAHSYKSHAFLSSRENRYKAIKGLVDAVVAATDHGNRHAVTNKAAKFQFISVKSPDFDLLKEDPYKAVHEAVQHESTQFHYDLYSYLMNNS